jgi:hypothetical protein
MSRAVWHTGSEGRRRIKMTDSQIYTFEKLEKFSRQEFIDKINFHLAELGTTKAEVRKAVDAAWVQLLIQELAAREQRSQAQTMVRCTVIVTVLTAVITVMTGIMMLK